MPSMETQPKLRNGIIRTSTLMDDATARREAVQAFGRFLDYAERRSLSRTEHVKHLRPVFDTAETYFRLSAAAAENNLRGPEREQFIIQGLVENGVIDSGDSQEAVRGYKVVREGCELNRYHWQNMLGKMTRNGKRR